MMKKLVRHILKFILELFTGSVKFQEERIQKNKNHICKKKKKNHICEKYFQKQYTDKIEQEVIEICTSKYTVVSYFHPLKQIVIQNGNYICKPIIMRAMVSTDGYSRQLVFYKECIKILCRYIYIYTQMHIQRQTFSTKAQYFQEIQQKTW